MCVPIYFQWVITMNLTEVNERETACINHIHMGTQAKQRLCHIGIYEGAHIKVERKKGKGKAILLLVRGNFMMMRCQDAQRIEVEVI